MSDMVDPLREAAWAVVNGAEQDDNFDGELIEDLLSPEAIVTRRADLASRAAPSEPPDAATNEPDGKFPEAVDYNLGWRNGYYSGIEKALEIVKAAPLTYIDRARGRQKLLASITAELRSGPKPKNSES